MCSGLAPTAMRTPISRVRSVTLTSMMFMMPMPPTSSEMAAMPASSRVRVRALSSWAEAVSLRLRIEKSSGAPGWMPWRSRSSSVTWRWARLVASAELAPT